jgi:hypothetical protein
MRRRWRDGTESPWSLVWPHPPAEAFVEPAREALLHDLVIDAVVRTAACAPLEAPGLFEVEATVVRTTDPTVAGVAATFLLDLPVVAGDQLLAFLDEVGAGLVAPLAVVDGRERPQPRPMDCYPERIGARGHDRELPMVVHHPYDVVHPQVPWVR